MDFWAKFVGRSAHERERVLGDAARLYPEQPELRAAFVRGAALAQLDLELYRINSVGALVRISCAGCGD